MYTHIAITYDLHLVAYVPLRVKKTGNVVYGFNIKIDVMYWSENVYSMIILIV